MAFSSRKYMNSSWKQHNLKLCTLFLSMKAKKQNFLKIKLSKEMRNTAKIFYYHKCIKTEHCWILSS